MAKQTWNNPIDKTVDWGGDATTGNLPVSGEMVQRFIKESLDGKAGLFHYDATNNRYLVFADTETRDEYLLDPTQTELIIGTFDAPFNYTAEISLTSAAYNAVFLGSTGNYIDFTFDIKNKQGASTGENVTVTYTFIRNANRVVVKETRKHGDSVHFNVDEYLGEGTNTVIVGVTGQTSLAATTVAITYQVVNLSLTDETDIAKEYNLVSGSQVMEVPFTVSGYGTKVVEWYLDGALLDFVKAEDEVVDVTATRTKYITLSNLRQGSHSLQIRAYTVINGENFYTDTLYRDVMVYTGANDNVIIGVAVTIPRAYGVLGASDAVAIYDMIQYVPYTLRFATYSPTNASNTAVTVTLDGQAMGTVGSVNGITNEFSLVSKNTGTKTLSLTARDVVYSLSVLVEETTMNLQEITNNLVLDFDALGKTNQSSDKDQWSYGDYTGTLRGFNWNNTSGWVNGRLEMNAGSSFGIDLAPLAGSPTSTGKTIEIEWSTKNVSNDDAVICDLRGSDGVGILITATKVSMTSADGVVVETEYKSDENVRVGFVINQASGTTNQRLSFIYANGIVSRGEKWAVADSYTSNAEILFSANDEAELSLKAIRIYDVALTNDQMLNNYILYRDTIDEMMSVYDRNDVYEEGTTTFSPDKMSSRLPVMIVTGDIPTLENTSDSNTQIVVDIEYYNMQDTSKSFRMTGAAMRPQGTSSMGYPKKNFRIYTEKLDGTVLYDAEGNVVSDKLYSFKDGAQPVNCWCLKADYAESSGTHNTGIARLWNEALVNAQVDGEYVCRTEAQKIAIDSGYEYDVRTAIDGFPILLFYRPSANDDLIFIGKYNFNNDKSTESVFGFTFPDGVGMDEWIANYGNTMQCWEILNNGNALALFTTTDGFDEGWSEAFESRYPDTKTPDTSDLKAFCQWMVNVTQEEFATEKWEHLNVYMMAAYWSYLMRHAAADQFVKNAMFTSEDGQHFYFILYDNDTINGLINTGRLRIRPTDGRQTVDESGSYVFAGHDSRLWNMLEADEEFIDIVSAVDNALYSAGISYANTIHVFDDEQADKWVEKVYNQDAQYKYVGPYVEKGIDNLFMLQGKRDLHRRWWLAKRFAIFDAKYVSGTYKSQAVEIKCLNGTAAGQSFSVTAGYPLDYGYGINNIPREFGVTLGIGESHTFTTEEVVNLGDPIRIYGAPNIAALDFSPMSSRLAVVTISNVYDDALGTKLTKLVLGNGTSTNAEVSEISGLKQAVALEYLDVQGMSKIISLDLSNHAYFKTLKAFGSGLASVTFSKGAPVENLGLPTTMRILALEQLPYLRAENILFEDLSNLTGMTITSCPNISKKFDFVYDWVSSKTTANASSSLIMDNVNWSGVSGEQMLAIAQIGVDGGTLSLKGKVVLMDMSEELGEIFVSVFGQSVFDENAEFYIGAPTTLSIYGVSDLLEGEEAVFTAKMYPYLDGFISFSLPVSKNGCSIDPISGVLTTTETGEETSDVVVRATFVPADGSEAIVKEMSVTITKRTYPADIVISGDGDLKTNAKFSWSTSTDESLVNGDYEVVWSISGEASTYYGTRVSGRTCTLVEKSVPPTSITGTLSVSLTKKVDGTTVVSDSVDLDYTYIYPSSVAISGATTIVGGNDAPFTAAVSPSNVDVSMTYEWSISGSSNVFISSSSGNQCVVGTATPNEEESFTLTCVASSSDGRVSVRDSLTVTLQSKPNFITATYNVTSTSSATQLLYSSYTLSDVTYMEIDGVEVTPIKTYTFSTTGEHSVKMTLATLSGAFRACSTITALDFTECNGIKYDTLLRTFYGCSKLTSIEWGECAFPNATTLDYTFYNCSALTSIDLSPFEGAPITSLDNTFYKCSKLTSIDLSPFEGAPITSLGSAFYNCSKLTSIDLSPFEGAPITSLNYTFYNCSALTSIDLSPFEGAPITNLYYTFYNCSKLTSIDLSPFEGAPITSLGNTFYNCSTLTSIDLSPFEGAPITNLNGIFYNCSALTSIDLSPLAGASITNLNSIFYNCSALTSIEWGECAFPNATTLEYAFYNCWALTSIDLSPFEGATTMNLTYTFYKCWALTSIDLSPLAGASITSLNYTFYNCSALKAIIAPWATAPTANKYTFGNSTTYYTGRNTYSTGENMLYVPSGATGYDSGYWLDPLQDSSKCGFTLSATL